MLKRPLYISSILIGLFAVAISYDYFINKSQDLSNYVEDIETTFRENEEETHYWLNTPNKLKDLFTVESDSSVQYKSEQLAQLAALADEEYSLFWYCGDTLKYWSKNEVVPSELVIKKLQSSNAPLFVKLPNGYYQVEIRQLVGDMEEQFIIAAIPIKREYSFESDYLKNAFASKSPIPQNIFIDEYPTDFPILNRGGDILCYLDSTGHSSNKTHQLITLLLYLLAFTYLAILINNVANYLVERYQPWVGAAFLVSSVMGIRYLSIGQNIPEKFSNLDILSRSFATPVLNSSLGDLIINSVLFLWLMVFFHREFRIKSLIKLSPITRFIMTSLNYFPIVLGLLMITGLFKSLVVDSGIVFDFENVFNLDVFSFLSIISLILLLIALFLFTHRMMLTIKSIGMSRYARLGAFSFAILISLPFIISADLLLIPFKMVLVTIIYVLAFDIFIDNKLPGFTWMVIWLFLFSAYSAALLFKYNLDRDLETRKDFAVALAESRDSIAEMEINRLSNKIIRNDSIKKLFSAPLPFQIEEKLVREQIEQYSVSGNYVFSNFNYVPLGYNPSFPNLPLIKDQDAKLIDPILNLHEQAKPTDYPNLFIWPRTDKNLDFLIRYAIPIPGNEQDSTQVLIGLKQKNQDASRVYTELLLNPKTRYQEKLNEYNLAIYENNILIDNRGKISPELVQSFAELEEGEFVEKTTETQANLIYKGKDNTYVILARSRRGLTKGISLFSYLFVLIIITIMVLSLLNSLILAIPDSIEISVLGKPSLRNRIQLSVIALNIGSFILIGLVTVAFFRTSTNNYHENRLERKLNAVLSNMENDIALLSKEGKSDFDLSKLVVPISKIHKMDINIYGTDGKLVTTSENFIFERGFIGDRMDMIAMRGLDELNQPQIIKDEQIGQLKYRSAYVPLHDPKENVIGYIGLPYYTKDRSLRSDVYDFMGTLLNVYVFLLLLAGAIAIAVANSITSPITSIGEKLKGLKLGKNEPLEWNSQDELGVLIAEYNSMIQKLEKSTELLKKSEREGAWREMAKQVAHEIKNPLTPMKLSIQHLARAFKSSDNIEPLLNRVSQTLIEQIDGLSKIASEFSNFAKMPSAENDRFVINDLVRSVHELFDREQMGQMDIKLYQSEKRYAVFADKGHIMRVLNNLIKNAIQAIPDGRRGKIDISIYEKNDRVVVRVSDNGQGISDEMKEKVFYPNFTTKNSGMGLGLAISKSIIDAIDGAIYFKTVVNKGTDFYVELPIQEVLNEELSVSN